MAQERSPDSLVIPRSEGRIALIVIVFPFLLLGTGLVLREALVNPGQFTGRLSLINLLPAWAEVAATVVVFVYFMSIYLHILAKSLMRLPILEIDAAGIRGMSKRWRFQVAWRDIEDVRTEVKPARYGQRYRWVLIGLASERNVRRKTIRVPMSLGRRPDDWEDRVCALSAHYLVQARDENERT